eukprot:70714-Chlamydomonas_euryale.AAC.2
MALALRRPPFSTPHGVKPDVVDEPPACPSVRTHHHHFILGCAPTGSPVTSGCKQSARYLWLQTVR